MPQGEIKTTLQIGNVDVDAKREVIKLVPLKLATLGAEINGDVGVQNFSRPKISFTLTTDAINLDAILPSSDNEAEQKKPENSDDKIELPIEMLRQLRLDGSLNIASLIASGIHMQDVVAKIFADGGAIKLSPTTLKLYDGSLLAEVTLDVRGATPVYRANSTIKEIKIEDLLADIAEDGKVMLRGRSALTFNLDTSGDRISGLKQQLNGNANFAATDGALVNEKLAKNIERVAALLKGREPKPTGEEVVFDSLMGSAVIQNGAANNDDTKLVTPLIFGTGKGVVDIGQSTLNYTVGISLAEDAARSIPITTKSPFDDLKYGVDLKAALSEQQKQAVEQKKQEPQEKVDEKIKEKIGDGAGDALGDKIKDKFKLF